MKHSDRTEMGGDNTRFDETEWARISQARTENEGRRQEAVSAICDRYWKPVYCYLRRKGYDNESAKDITQGFFQDVVLGKDLPAKADKSKGRFRTFLLTALDRYVSNVRRAASAKKRSPAGRLVSLDALDSWQAPAATQCGTPDEAFAYAWASDLLDEVLVAVEADCRASGQDAHWDIFRRTVIDPCLNGTKAPLLAEVCKNLGIAGEAKASNMCITVKRKFKAALWVRVRPLVASDGDVDQEIHDLMKILSGIGAGGGQSS